MTISLHNCCLNSNHTGEIKTLSSIISSTYHHFTRTIIIENKILYIFVLVISFLLITMKKSFRRDSLKFNNFSRYMSGLLYFLRWCDCLIFIFIEDIYHIHNDDAWLHNTWRTYIHTAIRSPLYQPVFGMWLMQLTAKDNTVQVDNEW